MTDLTLTPTFIDRGGKQVYDVMSTESNDPNYEGTPYKVGQARLAPDPRLAELIERVKALPRHTRRGYDGGTDTVVYAGELDKAMEEGK